MLKKYLKSIADALRNQSNDQTPINAKYFPNVIDEVCSSKSNEGYFFGYEDGFWEGHEAGEDVGYEEGFAEGEVIGYNNGHQIGVEDGYDEGFVDGGLSHSPQETVSGEALGITDTTPIEHNMGVSVRGKNLIPNSYKTTTSNGVTFTVEEDGSIVANGTSTKAFSFIFIQTGKPLTLIAEKNYVFSGSPSGSSYSTYYMAVQSTDYTKTYNDVGKGIVFTSTGKNIYGYISVQANITLDNVVFKPMLELGTTSTSYAPYIEDISTVKLLKQGKNFFKTTNYTKGTLDNKTGNISTNQAVKTYCLTTDYIYLKSGAYVLSNKAGANLRYICFYNANKGFKSATWTDRAKKFKFTITEDCYVRIDTERDANVAIDNFDTFLNEYEFMLELGTTPTEYEPYIEPVIYDVPTDGTVEGVKSLYPNTTLYTDTSGAVIDCTYYQDGKKVKENLIDIILSLGGVINE